ncbi:sigma-54-dependent Fis family transcriptional regulator [Roseivirga sp. 4D4]|uniref:sigma-54-dependent transcriptional regulator n=1 Tax=Roseivirga sp. 4D4 TaxID=1889784 RepID=UPI000853C1CC|nr:sigma-54 dependent transcriptional regulator [Roseivirga sp. 4D4]OEK02903.1 sigma-54-dependent Fis family transcriptional regulator [Roseivirga sp. 4D4]
MSKERILIIDDDPDICLLLKKYLAKKGYETFVAEDGKQGEKWLKDNNADLVLCDFKLPDYTGLEMLQKIKIIDTRIQVVIITGYSDVRIAVEALKKGAYEYVTKPLYPDEILITIENALNARRDQEEVAIQPIKKKSVSAPAPEEFVNGVSPASQTVIKHIDLIAPTDMSVIVLGETGTGKEYVAKAIHNRSKRAGMPFVALDCGALPKELAGSELFGHIKGAFTGAINDKRGCFEAANGGTLFLDELGNLSYDNQVKLLRVLQERRVKPIGSNKEVAVDVRVIVATNENLKEAVARDEFREDIYHRLNEFKIELSPLRERPDDIEVFAEHFLQSANAQLGKSIAGFEPKTMEVLKAYTWHGNLRELKNVVKRSVLLCQDQLIGPMHLPQEILSPDTDDVGSMAVSFNGELPKDLKSVAEEAEKKAILAVLRHTNNNKSQTADFLKVDRKTLYNKLKAYEINI